MGGYQEWNAYNQEGNMKCGKRNLIENNAAICHYQCVYHLRCEVMVVADLAGWLQK